ncbi:MAG: signal recognition particle protein, partial [Methylococcaceae bacterium]|nr:signal recognition particle protein [Methylococcaceae bacterium]
LAKKIQKGKSFDFNDLKEQLEQMQSMGGLTAMMDKLPGMGNMPKEMKEKVNDKDLARQIAVINSMTPQERRFPDLIKGTRKQRIADGSGQDLQAVNRILKQHQMMEKMMKKFSKGNIVNMMRGMQGNMKGMRF